MDFFWYLHVVVLGKIDNSERLVIDSHDHVSQSVNVLSLLLAPAVPVADQIGVNAGKEMLIADIGWGENRACRWAVEPL